MCDALTADWLDGPAFMAWLQRQLPIGDELPAYLSGSRIARFRAGDPVSFVLAERLCHRLNRDIYDVPDEVFLLPCVVYRKRQLKRSARWYERRGMEWAAQRYREAA